MLTHRAAWLTLEHGVSPHGLMAVTFTSKAAAEMSGCDSLAAYALPLFVLLIFVGPLTALGIGSAIVGLPAPVVIAPVLVSCTEEPWSQSRSALPGQAAP